MNTNYFDMFTLSDLLDFIKICEYNIEELIEKRNKYSCLKEECSHDVALGFNINDVAKTFDDINKKEYETEKQIEYYTKLKKIALKEASMKSKFIDFKNICAADIPEELKEDNNTKTK